MVLWYLFEQICWNFDIFLLLSAVVHIAYKRFGWTTQQVQTAVHTFKRGDKFETMK
jgi:hypothetical protein